MLALAGFWLSATGVIDSVTERVSPPPDDGSDCRITIDNGLVSIHEEADTFSQEIIRVPKGTYLVIDSVQLPRPDNRWLKITVDGRSGWVRDMPFNIKDKSRGCR